jgi:hypothetical protein
LLPTLRFLGHQLRLLLPLLLPLLLNIQAGITSDGSSSSSIAGVRLLAGIL